MSDQGLLAEAVLNNAAWCVAVWRSHGLAVERRLGLTACAGQPPRFHPNAVTIDAGADAAVQTAWLTELADAAPAAVSVKDSFATLDLAPARFLRLFEAQWLARPAALGVAASAAALEWRLAETEDQLADWEAAWAGRSAVGTARLFRPDMLTDRGIGFMAGYRRGELAAGCVLTPTGGVVGIGNVFGSYEAAVDIAATMFPGRTIVGYEHGEALRRARAHGFRPLGPLNVWFRPGSTGHISDNLS